MIARVNISRLRKLAEAIKFAVRENSGMNFYSVRSDGIDAHVSDTYPGIAKNDIEARAVINFFFFTTLHNHGFWYDYVAGYNEPIYGVIGGKQTKGSTLLFKLCKHAFDKDRCIFEPYRLKRMSVAALQGIFSDDFGPVSFPDMEHRTLITNRYGGWFAESRYYYGPPAFVTAANSDKKPLERFVRLLSEVPGFGDPLKKKSMLLAMELYYRPERFLRVTDHENWAPIVDYHIMRVLLRTGAVVLSKGYREHNRARFWVASEVESAIRIASYRAVLFLLSETGISMSALDYALWTSRGYCPEMKAPECEKCIFDSACAKDKELFQPVLRTMYY